MIFFLFIKFFAYFVFIYFGFQTFCGDKAEFVLQALGLAIARFIFGLICGWLSVVCIDAALSGAPGTSTYSDLWLFLTILPSSFVLWLVTAAIVSGRLNKPVLSWAAGGLAISLMFDGFAILFVDSRISSFC